LRVYLNGANYGSDVSAQHAAGVVSAATHLDDGDRNVTGQVAEQAVDFTFGQLKEVLVIGRRVGVRRRVHQDVNGRGRRFQESKNRRRVGVVGQRLHLFKVRMSTDDGFDASISAPEIVQVRCRRVVTF
jgi:hypothetical protein